ncbi:MAG: hypothetical protein JXB39_03540 [Deltaproteobacteria bacterium]|nr:hypothetical protein [Deltaproteobacteria bacterium]
MRPALLLLAVLAGCSDPPEDTGTPPDDTGTPPDDTAPDDTAPDDTAPDDTAPDDTAPEVSVSVSAAPAFDPILGGPLAIFLTSEGATSVEVQVLDAKGNVVATPTDAWDGRDAKGAWAPAGAYTVQVVGTRGKIRVEDAADVHMVRCGVARAWAEGDEGVSAESVALWWYGTRTLQDLAQPFVSLDALEDVREAATVFPEVTSELVEEPRHGNLPLAFTWDSRPILTLELGEDTVLGSPGLEGADVSLGIPGWTALAGAEGILPDVPVVLQADAPLAAGPSVVETTLEITFEVTGDDAVTHTIGVQNLPVRFYAVYDSPTFTRKQEDQTAWVAAVDPALRALAGVKPDPDAILDALVDWVYYDHDIAYDTYAGASAYTDYISGYDQAVFALSAYLERRFGRIVNCSDCASILVAWANMLGVPLDYTIILSNFYLNYIRAIGCDEYTHCPFGPYGCGFSYHAVTTDDEAATIWDATLALDGDEDPSNPPSSLLMVQHIEGDEYLERLVMSGTAYYEYSEQVVVQ